MSLLEHVTAGPAHLPLLCPPAAHISRQTAAARRPPLCTRAACPPAEMGRSGELCRLLTPGDAACAGASVERCGACLGCQLAPLLAGRSAGSGCTRSTELDLHTQLRHHGAATATRRLSGNVGPLQSRLEGRLCADHAGTALYRPGCGFPEGTSSKWDSPDAPGLIVQVCRPISCRGGRGQHLAGRTEGAALPGAGLRRACAGLARRGLRALGLAACLCPAAAPPVPASPRGVCKVFHWSAPVQKLADSLAAARSSDHARGECPHQHGSRRRQAAWPRMRDRARLPEHPGRCWARMLPAPLAMRGHLLAGLLPAATVQQGSARTGGSACWNAKLPAECPWHKAYGCAPTASMRLPGTLITCLTSMQSQCAGEGEGAGAGRHTRGCTGCSCWRRRAAAARASRRCCCCAVLGTSCSGSGAGGPAACAGLSSCTLEKLEGPAATDMLITARSGWPSAAQQVAGAVTCCVWLPSGPGPSTGVERGLQAADAGRCGRSWACRPSACASSWRSLAVQASEQPVSPPPGAHASVPAHSTYLSAGESR